MARRNPMHRSAEPLRKASDGAIRRRYVAHMSEGAPAAPSPTIVLRPNVEQANIAALRDAYSKMQKLMARDNRSWIYWAEVHGFNRFDCWHHSTTGPNQESRNPRIYSYDLFLPWH